MNIQIPALRIIGNLMMGDEECLVMLSKGALNHISQLIKSDSKVIKKDIAWIFSNLCAGSPHEI